MPKQTKTADLAVNELVAYEFQTFKLYSGKKAEALQNSVRENGVLTPILVRPKDDQYEILSGHNRVTAARAVGLPSIPAVILDEVSDDEARLIATVSNLIQRSFADLSHSERAAALSAHYEAVKSQGKRTDLIAALDDLLDDALLVSGTRTSDTMYQKLNARELVAATYGLAAATVEHYLCVAKLIQPLLDRLDNGEFPVRAAVDVSRLKPEEQAMLDDVLKDERYTLDMRKARNFKSPWRDEATGLLTESRIKENLANPVADVPSVKVKVKKDVLSRYFNDNVKADEIADTIEKALQAWFANDAGGG